MVSPPASAPESALAGVRRRRALDGSLLLLARDDEVVVGFALGAPRLHSWELFHLAVDPDAWGRGIASVLLESVDQHARAQQFGEVELWVIDDDAGAIRVYERAGFRPTDDVVTDPTSGRDERRLTKALG